MTAGPDAPTAAMADPDPGDRRRPPATAGAYTAAVPLDVSDRPELLVILDSHGIIYRSYFALREAFASTVRRTGEPVWAVYGYANSLLYTLDELHPTHIIAAWDGPGPTFRHEADADYKATRAPMPDDLKPQLGRVRELLDAFRIPVVEAPGYEADDVLGTLATQAAAAGVATVLVTLDNDMVQLVQPGVRVLMYRPYQRDYVLYDEERVRERWSFGPERMTDYKALVGDTTDNIAGVKGIGEKGAKALIEQWGTIEEMLDHLEEITPQRAQKALAAAQEEARHYKHLATIVTDVPEAVLDLDAARVHEYDRGEVLQLFQELEFRSLVARLPQHADMTGAPESAEHAEGAITRGGDYELVTTPQRLAEVVEAVQAARRFGFEVVADDEHPMRAAFCLVGVALSIEAGRGWYLPFGHTQEAPPLQEGQQELDLTVEDGGSDGAGGTNGTSVTDGTEPASPLEQLARETVLEAIAPLFTDPAIEPVSNSGKNQMLALGAAPDGFWTQAINFDTSIAGYVLGERAVDVRGLAFERLGHELVEPKSLLGTGRKAIPFSRSAPGDAKELAVGNADATLRLAADLAPELATTQLDRVFAEIDIPHIPVLARMEQRGLAIDREALEILGVELATDVAEAERGVYEAVGHEFQIGSPQQLSQVLFEELELPKSRKTATGWTRRTRTPSSPLRAAHPAVEAVLRWRELTKIKSTYVDTLPLQVNPHTGRVHTVFSQTTAATGRLSSNDPNLQNIPVRTEIGNAVRSAFVARDCGEDPLLLSLDYSQIELRILAHVSGDEELRAAFLGGADIHRTNGVAGVRGGAGRRRRGDAAAGEGVQLRRALRADGVRAVAARGHPARGRGGVHPRLLRGLPDGGAVARRRRHRGARSRLRRDAGGAAALHPGAALAEPQPAAGGGADRDQHADPGDGGGHHQDRDEPHRRGADRASQGRRAGAHGAAGPRRAAVRAAARGAERGARNRAAADALESSWRCRWSSTRSSGGPGAEWSEPPRRRLARRRSRRMPELPEVETIRRDLEPHLVGRTIERARIHPGGERLATTHAPRELERELARRRIEELRRHGKYLLARLDDGRSWVLHLRMTGLLLLRGAGDASGRFERACVDLDDGSSLRFEDARKFGTWHLVDEPREAMPRVGPDALSEAFTPQWLREALGRAQRAGQDRAARSARGGRRRQHLRRRGALARRHRSARARQLDRPATGAAAARGGAAGVTRGPRRPGQLLRLLPRRLRGPRLAPPAGARLSPRGRAVRAGALPRPADLAGAPRRSRDALLRELPAGVMQRRRRNGGHGSAST